MVQATEASDQQGGPRLVHAVVVAEAHDVVSGRVTAVAVPGAGGHGVRAQAPRLVGQRVVVGGKEAALAAGQDLVREEAVAGRQLRTGGRSGGARSPRSARARDFAEAAQAPRSAS